MCRDPRYELGPRRYLYRRQRQTQTDPSWSVTVDAGISLVSYANFTNVSQNDGYTIGAGHILDFVQNVAGFPNAGLVTNGQVTTMSFTGTTADLFVSHFGCGGSGKCFDVWLFSGNTTFTVNSLNGFSNINAFSNPSAVPLPPAAFLFGSALVGLGVLGRRRKKAGMMRLIENA